MYYLEDICFLCLKNNIKLQSVLIEDIDGIVVNEKLRCIFPEIIDSTLDTHKLACLECLEKLRISYDFKQSVIYNNSLFRDYIDKLHFQHKSRKQLFVVLAHSKRKTNVPLTRDIAAKSVENRDSLTNENFNLTSTHQEQLNTYDHSCQLTTNENVAVFTKFSSQPEEIHFKTEKIENNDSLIITNENLNLTSTNQEQVHTYDHSGQLTTNENVAFFTKCSCQPENINFKTENNDSLIITNENLNLTSTNQEQINTYDHSGQLPTAFFTKFNCQPEEIYLKTEIIEKNEKDDEKLNRDSLTNENFNLTSTYQEQLNTYDHSCQLTTNEKDIDLKPENLEIIEPLIETDEIHIKGDPFVEDNFSTKYLDEESMESEGNSWEMEDNLDIEMVEDSDSSIEEDSNKKLENTAHNLKNQNLSVGKHQDSVDTKFCATCQELLFRDLNNINLHLNIHIQMSDCSFCDEGVKDINRFKRHLWKHCERTQLEDIADNGEKLPCAICKKEFKSLNSLKKHIYTNYIKSLDCMFCSSSFTCRRNVMIHVLKLHIAVKPYQCKVCNKRFTSKKSAEKHMICAHYGGKVLVCKICKQKYRNPKSLQNHFVKMHGKRKIKIKVNIGSEDDGPQFGGKVTTTGNLKKFNPVVQIETKQEMQFSDFTVDEQSKKHEENNSEIQTNSRTINSAEEQCNSLNFYSNDLQPPIDADVTKQNVTETTKSAAPINLSNTCLICQKMYRYLNNLLLHLNVHMEESKCAMCNESSDNISNFQRRRLVPCGSNCQPLEKTITETIIKTPCAVCKEEFHLDSLKKHLRTHIHNLTCVLCSKSYIGKHGKDNLHRHLLVHCDVKAFQCEVCLKRFAVRDSLKYHINNIHSKVSREIVTCQYCKQLFSINYLRRHIVNLHAEKTFRCNVCKKVYIHSKDLEKHVKIHENQETT